MTLNAPPKMKEYISPYQNGLLRSHNLVMALILASVIPTSCNLNSTTNPEDVTNNKSEKVSPYIQIYNKEGHNLIDINARIDTLAEGFNWSEGPLYIEDGDYLLLSDVPENRVYKWSKSTGKEVYLEPSGYGHPKLQSGNRLEWSPSLPHW